MKTIYYTPPPEEAFTDMKAACIWLWRTYDNEYGYANEKIDAIKDIRNVGDNFMFMFAMFDVQNQAKIVGKLTKESRKELKKRMVDGGNTPYYLAGIGL